MRKSKREITDFHEILDIIQNMDTIRIGIHDGKYPYVVPVSFGYDSAGGRLAFYFHGAKEGKKAGLLAKNPHVCVEGDICYRFSSQGHRILRHLPVREHHSLREMQPGGRG